jgi:hypothetical protein
LRHTWITQFFFTSWKVLLKLQQRPQRSSKMGFYDGVKGQVHRHTVYNNDFQEHKLNNILNLYNKSRVDIWQDFIDVVFANHLEILGGRITYKDTLEMSCRKLIDDYIKLKEVKGLVPKTFVRIQKRI